MFSGLIQDVGRLTRRRGREIAVRRSGARPRLGDSVAINGVCLTVTRQKGTGRRQELFFDLSPETLEKTTLGRLPVGSPVNVETALTMADALGGHIVQGHVDGVGRVAKIQSQGGMKTIWFSAPAGIMKYIVPKGSVAVDGVSLTAARVAAGRFAAALIPFTLEHTNLGRLKAGDRVNLEADIIGKYVSKYLKRK
jgi:riboflavin synthase